MGTPTPTPQNPIDEVSRRQLQAIFGSAHPQHLPGGLAAQALGPNPLEGADTVELATDAILAIQDLGAKTGTTHRYPRNLLKVQHLVAFLLVNPFASTGEVCRFFNISPNTYATLTKSDTYRQLMEAHGHKLLKAAPQELTDKIKDTLELALDKVQTALLASEDGEFALNAADKMANRMGLGAKHQTNVQINNNVVTAEMINKAKARRLPPPAQPIIDVTPNAG